MWFCRPFNNKSWVAEAGGFSLPGVLVGVGLLGVSAVVISNTVVDARRSQQVADIKLSANKLQQAILDAVTGRIKEFMLDKCSGARWGGAGSTEVEKAFSRIEIPIGSASSGGTQPALKFYSQEGDIPTSFKCSAPVGPAFMDPSNANSGQYLRFCMEIDPPGHPAVSQRLLELLVVPINLASDSAIACEDTRGAGAAVKVTWQMHNKINKDKVKGFGDGVSVLKESGTFLISAETESYSGTCSVTATRQGVTNQCTVNVSGLGRRPPTLLKTVGGSNIAVTGITWARAPSANNDAFTTTTLCETNRTTSFTAQSADGGSFCSAVVQQTGCSAADTITFEGAGLARNTSISNQFQSSHGVVFSLSDGSRPILGQVNTDNPSGWTCNSSSPGCGNGSVSSRTNVLLDNTSRTIVGQLFLMQLNQNANLIITYSDPVSEASGYIIDIDNTEIFTVTPINAAGVKLTGSAWSYQAGVDDFTYNGRAMKWTVERPSNDIQKLEVNARKAATNTIGVAFDQFSPSKICP